MEEHKETIYQQSIKTIKKIGEYQVQIVICICDI